MTIPVSLAEAKRQLRHYDEDLEAERQAEIEGFIVRAAGWVERYTGHILDARDVTEEFLGFDRIRLRAWPIRSGAAPAVSYAATAGSSIGVSGARLVPTSRPAQIIPGIGARWPGLPSGAIVTVVVRAGYELDDTVPSDFKSAMLLLIAAYDADREGGDVLAKAETAARSLCSDYRLRRA